MFNRRTANDCLSAGILWLLLCAPLCMPLVAFAGGEQVAATQYVDELIDGIIVRYRTEQKGAALNARVRAAQAVAVQRGVTVAYFRSGALGIHVLRLGHKMTVAEVEDLAREIAANDPDVEYAEPDRIMQPMFTPNDTRYNEQWHYFEATGGINLPAAWDQFTGTNVTVAVIDTGYRPHVDLAANLLDGYDFISDAFMANDGNGRDSDEQDPGDWHTSGQCAQPPRNSSWHGTHVAGTIAALTNNSTGVAGVAFNARVLPARVLGRCGGTISDIADAMVWASGGAVSGVPANATPARVLNLSLGGSGSCSSTYQNAINSARSRNATVVVSAGNSSQDAINFQPANCSGVITIAATNRSGAKASYSNFGATVEIAAPGGETSILANGVLSTLNTGTTTPAADSYQFYQGTSMAAPHVSGVAALMLAKNPSLTPDQVLAHLQSTARSFPGTCSQCGSGIVNAAAAVSAVPDPGPPPPTPGVPTNLRTQPVGVANGGNYTVLWNASTGSVNHYTLHEVLEFGPGAPATADYIVIAPTTSKSFSKGGFEREFQYTVRACATADESACSAWSAPVWIGTCPAGGCNN